MKLSSFIIVAFVFLSLLQLSLSAPASAEITSLPGLKTKLNFKQYGGYINVNEAQDRNLYYWFVESQSKPSSDPLFLWLQGGPGCSSLLGFLTEHGPLMLTPDLDVVVNPYAWNQHANVLYLESPAGVGFSYYGNNINNFSTGDNETMADAYNFLQKWFQLYPEYKTNDFYVSGESYGGHYVPQLAWTILQENKNATSKINLKGILVGNPWTDSDIDNWSVPTFIYYHHLCSLPTWQRILTYCIDNTTDDFITSAFSPLPPLTLIDTSLPFHDMKKGRRVRGLTDDCGDALNTMFEEVGDLINQYDIYVPCLGGEGLDCSNYTAQLDFLNNPQVQAAIHAKAPATNWTVCASIDYNESWYSVLPIYPELMESIKVTVYGGDVTFNVPVLGTQIWVEGFNRKVESDYTAWLVEGQVAGYYKKFDGITYVTVKDSGHMVPTYTPDLGLALFEGYLAGKFYSKATVASLLQPRFNI